jgi:hypothetical protein
VRSDFDLVLLVCSCGLQELQTVKIGGSKAGTARYTVPPLPHEVFRRVSQVDHVACASLLHSLQSYATCEPVVVVPTFARLSVKEWCWLGASEDRSRGSSWLLWSSSCGWFQNIWAAAL